MKILFAAALLVGTVAAMAPAQASLLQFTVHGDYNASFQLDSHPVPDSFTVHGDYGRDSFTLLGIKGTFQGSTSGVADLLFANYYKGPGLSQDPTPGEFSIRDSQTGNQLFFSGFADNFIGAPNAPTFSVGYDQPLNNALTTRLMITLVPVTSTVPEPASLALLGIGAAGIAAVRRRRAA